VTDAAFMLAVLQDGPATTMEIISRSIAERGCGLTPHSRAAELRARGHRIECVREGERNGRPIYTYRLGTPSETQAVAGADSCVSLGASSNQSIQTGSVSARRARPEAEQLTLA
jgi:hypothetical protein